MNWIAVGKPSPGDFPGPALALASPDSCPHPAVCAAGTGRVGTPLAVARTTAWIADPAGGSERMVDILAHGDRVVVVRAADRQAEQRVDVLDASGTTVKTIEGRAGAWTIDPRGPMLLGTSIDGEPAAWSLTDPTKRPVLWSTRVEGRVLRDLRMIDDVLFLVAAEPRTLNGPRPNVLVEILQIPGYEEASRWRTLRNTTCVAERIAERTTHVVAGLEPDGPILATDDHVYWGDWVLEPRGNLELPGRPLLVAPRTDGRSWMLAQHDDEVELRLLAAGQCEHVTPMNPVQRDAERLLVGADDGVVVVSSGRIESFDPAGAMRWKFSRVGAPRALIDHTGTTLFTNVDEILAADPSGTCSQIWVAPAGMDELGPLAFASGRLFVGVGPRLFALT